MWAWFTANGVWILVALVSGLILFLALKRWANRLIRKTVPEPLHEQLDGIVKTATWVTIAIGGVLIGLSVAAVTLSALGGDITPALGAIGSWLAGHGVRILIIIGIAYLFHRLTKALAPRLIEQTITIRGRGRRAREEMRKRTQTLSRILIQGIAVIIALIATFMVLSELGIDITAALAGLGIVGLAVGFGAQYLIRDLIAGFFVFLENQYNVGDVIKVGDTFGMVEEVSLRRTITRDLDGARHVIPNGEIRVLSNYSQGMSRAHLNISVAYKEDLDRVMALMRKTWEEMSADETWSRHIQSRTPQILRVNEFGDSGITIKLVGWTEPIMQWDVMGEYLRRIKRVFDQEGIEIPWPHMKVYFGDELGKKGLPR
ncbi:MAG TPA: mechanosensitive ion channel family protein [Dehalococcoidia bacterium]|jgi:small conductance mechanosensitive channel|nr:mechanosensitive ion channel family protein [Dehalococcoidia bacterium]